MNHKRLKFFSACAFLIFSSISRAEDIDLFVGADTATTQLPNVLVILDNTANWNDAFTNEMAALASVVSNLPADKFRVGLMMFTETGGGDSGNDGAYVRAALRPLTAANKLKYVSLVNSFDKLDDKSNGGKISKAMWEAYLYYSAGTPHAGNQKNKTDYTGNTYGDTASKQIYGLSGNALASKAGAPYVSPVVDGCAKNYIIYISNGPAQDNNSDITAATSALAAAGGSTSTIPISPSGSQGNVADEWSRFMKKSNLNITSYAIDINKTTSGQGPGWTALLKSIAGVSSGKYFDITDSGSQIADTLNNIFSEIQSVDSVFASVSLPVSVNTQGTFLNQVFIGMFKPDPDSFPRWNGNLKQYKLGFSDGVLQLLDADGASAINASKGFIAECARSYWTPTTLDSYWQFKPQGNCITNNSDVSNSPDGNIVEKGGQAYQLRKSLSRSIKTCSPTACTGLVNFNSTNVSPSDLGVSTTAERNAIVNWQLGLDTKDENINANTTEMRPSVHGDVVHSRPVAINYGTSDSPNVTVFYGGNDGILRAVNGNRDDDSNAGNELWGFIAPEFYSKIKRIYDNTVTIKFPGHETGNPTPQAKDYGFDGSVTAYSEGGVHWIFAAMRRGGRALYSIDVTNSSIPSFKWKHTNLTLDGLGQTWSAPKAFKAAGYGSGNSPMVIMGGGYDTCHDIDGNTNRCGSMGKKIYVLDADNGALLKSFDTDSSVVADLTIVTESGNAKYFYAADLSGNVYRISGANANTPIGTSAPSDWTITKIARLGGDDSGDAANRKFMFAPDIIAIDSNTYGVLLGSGDREKPLASYTAAAAVSNRFYMIKDKPADTTWLTSEVDNCGANVLCNASLFPIVSSETPSAADLATKKGWYLALSSSEQVVTSAITVFNTITFSTHKPTQPETGACTSLGTATVYNVDYRDADPNAPGSIDRGSIIVGGGLPPSPVAGMVTLDNGTTVPFIIGGGTDSALQGGKPPAPSVVNRPKAKVYWNIKK
jgi:type IV pilus assembly protein PilY1